MSEREDNVYKAKLAEQAERYDGKLYLCCIATGGAKIPIPVTSINRHRWPARLTIAIVSSTPFLLCNAVYFRLYSRRFPAHAFANRKKRCGKLVLLGDVVVAAVCIIDRRRGSTKGLPPAETQKGTF